MTLPLWVAYQIPCHVCQRLVYTRMNPADPRILRAVCSAKCWGGIPEPDLKVKGVPTRIIVRPKELTADQRYEHPAPIRVATPIDVDHEWVPSGARSLAKSALSAGCAVVITYARGTMKTQTTEKVVDSIAVRMRRGERVAFGIWLDGRYKTGVILDRLCTAGARELKEWADERR